MLIEHQSQGDPCNKCRAPAREHRNPRARVWHAAKGDPCTKCGKSRAAHPNRHRLKRRAAYDASRTDDRQSDRRIIGIDGEGYDTPDGRHVYVYLAAVDEHGKLVAEAFNPEGLSHDACCAMLLSLPRNALKFGFMFSYDVTKIIEELPEAYRYCLMRPSLQRERCCKECKHRWTSSQRSCPKCGSALTRGYSKHLRLGSRGYKWFHGSLTVADSYDKRKKRWRRSSQIWDCFRFFGTSFVQALRDWGIGTSEQVARIAKMKAQRGDFQNVDIEAVKAYCREECHLLAVLMRRVLSAHDDAELTLKRYEGAGSTASVLLKKYEVAEYRGPGIEELPGELAHAISSAFFGGRFENSVVGPIKRKLWGNDVASAYPYALTFMPCLKCGRWRKLKAGRGMMAGIERAALAVCHFRVRALTDAARAQLAWAPLPFRDENGSIAYPLNFEGWAWKPELLAAMTGWPELIEVLGAYVYEVDCEHRPFDWMPAVYRRRCQWGKEGRGKVLKLGSNASYGKTAQHVGDDPPFRSMVWAGNTTATTRGQLLVAICQAKDPWNVLAVATDGLYAAEKLVLPAPRETETGDLEKAPLGGWEEKEIPEGAFFAKPGLYFRLQPELTDVRARGIGRREVFEQRERLQTAFDAWDRSDFDFAIELESRRFYGAKQSVYAGSDCRSCENIVPGWPKHCPKCGRLGALKTFLLKTPEGAAAYGTWLERKVNVSFDPRPKREAVMQTSGIARLRIREVGGAVSAPYKNGMTTPEGTASREAKEFLLEQPDWDDAPPDDE